MLMFVRAAVDRSFRLHRRRAHGCRPVAGLARIVRHHSECTERVLDEPRQQVID